MPDGRSGGAAWRLRVYRARVLEFALFFGSVVALQGSRFLFTLLVASGVPPAEFTDWAQFLTLVGYLPAMLLGVGNGMNRLVPIQIGGGDVEEARETESAAWWMVALAVPVSVGLGIVLGWMGAGDWIPAAFIAGGAVAVYQVQQFAMRSRLQFNRASAQQWGMAVLICLGGLVLVLAGATLGLALGVWTAAALLAITIGRLLRRPIVTRPSVDRTRGLMTMGFPIMLAGLLGSMFYTADRWVASAELEPAAAGTYALASLIASAVFLVPAVIAQQLYPRLAMLYGGHATADRLREAAHRQSLLAVLASAVTALAVTVFSLVIVPRVLPDYGEVTGPALVLAFGIVALAATTGYANLLVVVGALWAYLAILASSFAVAVILMWVGAGTGGAIGLALGVAGGQMTLMVAVFVAARTLVPRRVVR